MSCEVVLTDPNPNTALSQILLGVIERRVCACVCVCDLLWCLAYTTCICSPSWALTSQLPPGKHWLCARGACLAAFCLYRSRQWARSCSYQSSPSLRRWLSRVLCSLSTHLSCLSDSVYLPLFLSLSLSLSLGVELNPGRLPVTDWLMCRFCQTSTSRCALAGNLSAFGFLDVAFFIDDSTSSPSRLMCSAQTENRVVLVRLARLQLFTKCQLRVFVSLCTVYFHYWSICRMVLQSRLIV